MVPCGWCVTLPVDVVCVVSLMCDTDVVVASAECVKVSVLVTFGSGESEVCAVDVWIHGFHGLGECPADVPAVWEGCGFDSAAALSGSPWTGLFVCECGCCDNEGL